MSELSQQADTFKAISIDFGDFGWVGPTVEGLKTPNPHDAWPLIVEQSSRPLDIISFSIHSSVPDAYDSPGLYYPGGRFLPEELSERITNRGIFLSGVRSEKPAIGHVACLNGVLQPAYEGDEILPIDLGVLGVEGKVLSLNDIVKFYLNKGPRIIRKLKPSNLFSR